MGAVSFAPAENAFEPTQNASERENSVPGKPAAPQDSGDSATRRAAARQLIAAAITNARLISQPEDSARAFCAIALDQAKMGDIKGARESVRAAEKAAARVQGEGLRSQASCWVAVALAGVGDVKSARETARTADCGLSRVMAYVGISKVQAAAGDTTGARDTLAMAKASAAIIAYPSVQDAANCAIADAQIGARDILGASAIAARLNYRSNAVATYVAVGTAQARSGDLNGAKATLARVGDDPEADCLYAAVAAAQVRGGDAEGAMKTAARANDPTTRTRTYCAMAEVQAKARNSAAVRQYIDAADAAAAAVGDGYFRALAYRDVGTVQAKVGNLAAARKSFVAARNAVSTKSVIYDPPGAGALPTGGIGIWSQARAPDRRAHSLLNIVESQAEVGDIAGAKETAVALKASDLRALGYAFIARAYARVGEPVQARAEITKAKVILAGSNEPERRLYQLAIASAETAVGEVAPAIDYVASVVSDPSERCEWLATAAEQLLAGELGVKRGQP
jgi:aspartate 1-decarboxylase